ncbi:dihydrofolate reductase family protein [Paenibacillus tarimensis]
MHGGYLDEIQLHVVPVMLGHGTRLFEIDHPLQQELQCVSAQQSSGAVHLRYSVKPTQEREDRK